MTSTSIIELNRSALKNNLEFLKKEVGEGVRISSVIKGNAYGHGIKEFVTMALENGVDHFSVFSADEALEAFKSLKGASAEIMIMGDVEEESLEWAIENDIQFFVFEMERLLKAIEIAREKGKKAIIHIEAETGMNRTGFNFEQIKEVRDVLDANHSHVILKGLCTHFAGAESIANYLRIQRQLENYKKACTYFEDAGYKDFIRHSACSAAMVMYPETRMDMVRIGIMQYGYWPSPEVFIRFLGDEPERKDPLRRIIRWKSKVLATKDVHTGEFIGYGTSYLARKKMKIAVIPVGYAHGYSRTLSNQGRILIRGHRVGVVGIVNMNMLMADISQIPETKKGDEVVLIGNQGDMSISVSSFSEYSDQLNYELLARIPQNITRKITK